MKKQTRSFFDHFLSVLLGVFIVLFIWTFSLSIPIYVRSFYYVQIDTLKIEETSGYSKQTIKKAYADVLDYLTLHKSFGSGDLECSKSAEEHFADCQKLFDLNLALLIISFVGIVILAVLAHKKIFNLKKYFCFHVWFFAGIVAIVVPLIIGIFALVDFDLAFVMFHKILFPGKTNWYFDPAADQIINILPDTFFANCGILIGSVVFALGVGLVIVESIRKFKCNRIKI